MTSLRELVKLQVPAIFILLLSLPTLGTSQQLYLDWAKGYETSKTWGYDVVVDHNDDILSTGYFHGAFGDLEVTTTSGLETLSSSGQSCLIQKMDADGNILWAKSITGDGTSIGHSIAVDLNNYIYVTGYYYGSVDFDPGEETLIYSSPGVFEIYVIKLDSNGDFLWVKTMEGIGSSTTRMANSITVDTENNVLVTGEFDGVVDFNPHEGDTEFMTSVGSTDVFILKLNEDGDLIWVNSLEGTSLDNCFAIEHDFDDNIVVTGRFHGTVDFDPGIETEFHTDISSFGDVFTLKINKDGDFMWVNCIGGVENDFGEDVVTDDEGGVYTFGRFDDSVDFDPSIETDIRSTVGAQNSFIQKVDANGNFLWVKTIESGDLDGVADYNISNGITLDSEMNILLCGHFYGIIDLDMGAGEDLDTSNGLSDMYFIKLNPSGETVWQHTIGGMLTNVPEGLCVDSNDEPIFVGFIDGPTDFDPSEEEYILDNPTSRSMFVSKFEEGFIGISETILGSILRVYPNPTNNVQFVSIELNEPVDGILYFMDINGKLMEVVKEGHFNKGINKFEVNFSIYPDGVYYYVAFLKDGRSFYRKTIKL